MDDLKCILEEAGIALTDRALRGLSVYRDLLLDWNQRMDLTSVSEKDVAARHFGDSLSPLRVDGLFPPDVRVIDVGTGAGFPGLPIAIARPDLNVTLLEAQGKRCHFLNAVKERLSLDNVTVINDRAEVLGRAKGHREGYDRALARAVAPLNVLCEYLLPFVRAGGKALCWKGPAVAEEWADGQAAAEKLGGEAEEPIVLPQGDTNHVVIPIRKIQETLPQFPRKNGMPAKRPLRADKK